MIRRSEKPALLRAMRRWDLVALVLNFIVGAGIFGLPSRVQALAGDYSLLAYVACACCVFLIILCFAEVSSRFTETGGLYLYARVTFGPMVGFQIGWLSWLARLTGFAALCNLLADYLMVFVPAAGAGPARMSAVVSGHTQRRASRRITTAVRDGGAAPDPHSVPGDARAIPHPARGILVTAIGAVLLTVTGTFLAAARLSTVIRLATYAITCAAVPVLRRRGEAPAPFTIPGGNVVTVASLLLILWLFTGSEWNDAGLVVTAAGGGALLYFVYARVRRSNA